MQGTHDEQVPVQTTLSAVDRLRAVGDDVGLRIIEGGDHEGSLFGPGRLAEIETWIAHRLNSDR